MAVAPLLKKVQKIKENRAQAMRQNIIQRDIEVLQTRSSERIHNLWKQRFSVKYPVPRFVGLSLVFSGHDSRPMQERCHRNVSTIRFAWPATRV
jgi:hypothetical protein